jgi:LacI family transcriptional regulator
VLNDRDGVNDDTRATVQRVVDELGYVPDPGARKLARQGRHQVGLAASSDDVLYAPYYALLLDALQERFINEGYAVRLLETGPDGLPVESADGLVLLGVHLDDPRPAKLLARGIPFVMVGRAHLAAHEDELDGVSWVDIDNTKGLLEAVRHLVKLGHTRIAHLAGSNTGQATLERHEAYQTGLAAAGLTVDRRLVWDGEFTTLGGYRAVRRALSDGLEFSAIVASSDEMAVGAIAALEDAGLRVPWDVSVTGFDDLPLASQHRPPLTTVHQPIREVGRHAAALLLERMAGKPARSKLLQTHLIVRASSAAGRT